MAEASELPPDPFASFAGRAEVVQPDPARWRLPWVGVVLAAGRSQRLASVTGGGSTALLRLGGLSLVERAVRSLLVAGLERVVVVVGHDAGPVATVVGRLGRGRVRVVYADRWADGNGASLAAVQGEVEGEALFALVTADHVFGEGGLERRSGASIREGSRHACSGFALSPVGDVGRAGLQGAEVGDELADLLVGEWAAEVQAPGGHAGAGDAAGNQQAGLLVGGGGEELLGVEGGGVATGGGAAVAGGAVVGEQALAQVGVGGLLLAGGVGAQGRLLDAVEHESQDEDGHEHQSPGVVAVEAALQPCRFERGRLGGVAGHGQLLVQGGPSGGVRKSWVPRSGPAMSLVVLATSVPLSSWSSKRSMPRGAGPWTYSPPRSNTEPWQGHSNRPELLQNGTRQPRWGQRWERAKNCPPALASHRRPSLK